MAMAMPSDGDANGSPPAASSESVEDFAVEATAAVINGDTELSREERTRRALECDCVAELRDGPCGAQFSAAFYCFLTSTANDRGSDCIKPFIAMQTCIAANPGSFAVYNGEDDAEGDCAPQGNMQEGQPVASPPPGAIRNPI